VQITIQLLADYRRYLPEGHDAQGSYHLEISSGARVADALATLSIPPGSAYTFLANGRHAGSDQVLHEGDVLSIFPAVGGG
jgi:sulfur carrier protein ThiS